MVPIGPTVHPEVSVGSLVRPVVVWQDATANNVDIPLRFSRNVAPVSKTLLDKSLEDENWSEGNSGLDQNFITSALKSFVLDTTERTRNGTVAAVIDIEGNPGDIPLRSLSYVERPWGWSSIMVPLWTKPPLHDARPTKIHLPDDLSNGTNKRKRSNPFKIVDIDQRIYTIPIGTTIESQSIPLKRLQKMYVEYGGSKNEDITNSKPDIIQAIRNLIATAVGKGQTDLVTTPEPKTFATEAYITLPLYTLKCDLEVDEQNEVTFLEGEIVRLWSNAKRPDRLVQILDFEGQSAVCQSDDLEAIERPFGLLLCGRRAHAELRITGTALQPSFQGGEQVTITSKQAASLFSSVQ